MSVIESIVQMAPNYVEPEHSPDPYVHGQQYMEKLRGFYRGIGLHPRSVPYVLQEDGSYRNKDGSEITRDIDRERKHIQEYLASQPEDYQQSVRELADSLPPMTSECRISVCIPVHNEELYVYDGLAEWGRQISLDGNPLDSTLYELQVIVNGPRDYQRDNTLVEIERFRRDFPHIRFNIVDIELPGESGNVGAARKLLYDVTLQRSLDRQTQTQPFYLESCDIDMDFVDPLTLARRLREFDQHPHLDVVTGKQDFDHQQLMQNDYMLFFLRSRKIGRRLLSDRRLRPENNPDFGFFNTSSLTEGPNTAITAEAYALINGYYATETGADDFDTGKRIAILRGDTNDNGDFIPNTHTIKPIRNVMHTSPRRFIHAFSSNARPYAAFADLQTTKELRARRFESAIQDIPHARISEENKAAFEKVLTKHWGFYNRTITDEQLRQRLYGRFMFLLGFGRHRTDHHDAASLYNSSEWQPDYHITEDGEVRIDNIGNIQAAFERFRQRNVVQAA